MRTIVSENSPATHTTPEPRDSVGAFADRDRGRDALGDRIDLRDGAVQGVRDPERAAVEGDPGRPVAHADRPDDWPRRESIRTTWLESSVTQTLPPPRAMPRPSAPVGIRPPAGAARRRA